MSASIHPVRLSLSVAAGKATREIILAVFADRFLALSKWLLCQCEVSLGIS